MKEEKKRIEVISKESGLDNIHVDCNSKEGKMLIQVVAKETTMKKN